MALRPDIILAVQPVDAVGAMSRGNELAAQTNALRDQNALRDVYRTQGANILQGDQNALNQLAMVNAPAALEVQDAVTRNRTAQRQFEILNAQERRAIAEASAKADEAQRAQMLEATRREVFRFLAAPDAATFDRLVTEAGKPELVGQFASRNVLAADFVSSVEEAIKLGQGAQGPEWRQATPEEAAARGAVAGQINDKTGKFEAINPPRNQVIRTNPDGTFEIIEGAAGGAGGRPPTEGQLAGAGYLQRMIGAESVLSELEREGISAMPVAKSLVVGTRAEGFVLTPQEQRLAQAQRDWVRAKLRKESGAVIAEEEMAEEIKTYFPQPGEDAATIEQKQQARLRAERQMEIGAGSAAPLAGELSGAASGSGSPETTPAPASSTPSPQQSAPLPPDLQAIFDKYNTP